MQRLQLIGYTQDGQPVYAIFGGAPEGDGGGEGTDPNEGEGEGTDPNEGDGKGEDDFTPPSREQWELMQTKLKRANGEAASRRRWLEENGINPKNGERLPEFVDEEDDEPKRRPAAKKSEGNEDLSEAYQLTSKELSDLKKLRQREGAAAARREASLVKALSKSAVKGALVEAGWNGQGANLITKMVDLGEIEIDDDGNIVGLEDQIAEVKADMPDWFKKRRAPAANGTRRRTENESGGASDVDGADKGTRPVKKEPTGWLEQLSAQLDAQ